MAFVHRALPCNGGVASDDSCGVSGGTKNDARAISTRKRDDAVQMLGNLTILSVALNAAQSNLTWDKKRPEMMEHSLLPLNQSLLDKKEWNETAILKRGEELFERAGRVWSR
jgi:hypothetical protein